MWQLGAIASVDRWHQVTVEPFEGPLPRGAAPDTSVSWRSAEDRRRSHDFARRASFVTGRGGGDVGVRTRSRTKQTSRKSAGCMGPPVDAHGGASGGASGGTFPEEGLIQLTEPRNGLY